MQYRIVQLATLPYFALEKQIEPGTWWRGVHEYRSISAARRALREWRIDDQAEIERRKCNWRVR